MKKKKGFTLVELLAVIVILAVILIIAMPKISDVIKNSKEASLETTAKLIASQAEKKYTENQVLDGSSTIKCSDVAKISSNDYESCNITFDSKGNAKVSIVGKGKFEGMAVCNANKNSASISSDCSTNASYFTYEDTTIVTNVIVENIDKCTSYIQSEFEGIPEEQVTTLCNGNARTLKRIVSKGTIPSGDYQTAGLKVETIDGISITGYQFETVSNVEVKNMNKCKTYLADTGLSNEQLTTLCTGGSITIDEDVFSLKSLVLAEDIPPKDYENAGLKVTYENGGGTDVVIPSQIYGKTVLAIGDEAFYDSNTGDGLRITSVVIPNSVTSIGTNAFRRNKLTNVTIPSSVAEIGNYAFANNQITSIIFPDTPITLGCEVFEDNPIMEDGSYSYPSNVTVICVK